MISKNTKQRHRDFLFFYSGEWYLELSKGCNVDINGQQNILCISYWIWNHNYGRFAIPFYEAPWWANSSFFDCFSPIITALEIYFATLAFGYFNYHRRRWILFGKMPLSVVAWDTRNQLVPLFSLMSSWFKLEAPGWSGQSSLWRQHCSQVNQNYLLIVWHNLNSCWKMNVLWVIHRLVGVSQASQQSHLVQGRTFDLFSTK